MPLWLILAGPGYLGYGTSLLWAGAPKAGVHAFYDIAVSPGDRTVRRKSDQLVTAQLIGFDTAKVRLYAQYKGTSKSLITIVNNCFWVKQTSILQIVQ